MASEFQANATLVGVCILTLSSLLDLTLAANWLRYERSFSSSRSALILVLLALEAVQIPILWLPTTSKVLGGFVVCGVLVINEALLIRGVTFLKSYDIYWSMYDSGRIKEKRDGFFTVMIITHFAGIAVVILSVVSRQINHPLVTMVSFLYTSAAFLGLGVVLVILSWVLWIWFMRLIGAHERGPKALLSLSRMYSATLLSLTLVPILDSYAVQFYLNGLSNPLVANFVNVAGFDIAAVTASCLLLISKQVNFVMLGYTLWDVCTLPKDVVLRDETDLLNAVAPGPIRDQSRSAFLATPRDYHPS